MNQARSSNLKFYSPIQVFRSRCVCLGQCLPGAVDSCCHVIPFTSLVSSWTVAQQIPAVLTVLLRHQVSSAGACAHSLALLIVVFECCCCCCVDFIPFGRGVGDTLGPHEDDAVAGPLNLIVPVMYFGREHTRLFVRTWYGFAACTKFCNGGSAFLYFDVYNLHLDFKLAGSGIQTVSSIMCTIS